MRVFIRHATTYCYDQPTRSVNQHLRMTPRPHIGQHIVSWRIDSDIDCRLHETDDGFGNVVHSFTATGPFETFTIVAEGEVVTDDHVGRIDGAVERLPVGVYLRDTPLTEPDRDIITFANDTASGKAPLDAMHALLTGLKDHLRFDTSATAITTTAAEAFAAGHGVCQDFSHIMLSAARHLDIPARYVGGYLVHSDGSTEHEAGHAWMEAYLPDLGWVAFDPANGISADDAYVRVAVGFDYLSAAPIRGVQRGGLNERLDVSVLTLNRDPDTMNTVPPGRRMAAPITAASGAPA